MNSKQSFIAFAADGTVKVIDFGLSTVVPNASPDSNEVYDLSGETGSLRYMAPEVAKRQHYNHKVDVYSFSIMLLEIVTCQKPFDRMNRDEYYEKVVHGEQRPHVSKKIPTAMAELIKQCWDVDPDVRPTFQEIIARLADMPKQEMDQQRGASKGGNFLKKMGLRHTSFF